MENRFLVTVILSSVVACGGTGRSTGNEVGKSESGGAGGRGGASSVGGSGASGTTGGVGGSGMVSGGAGGSGGSISGGAGGGSGTGGVSGTGGASGSPDGARDLLPPETGNPDGRRDSLPPDAASPLGGSDGSAEETAPDPTGACYADGGLRYSGNPFVTRFVADPAAHVFNGRVYVYDTDDQSNDGTYWRSTVWHAFSSANLVDWTDEGTVLTLQAFAYASGKWAAWAPDVVSKDGKYYFFAPIDRWQIGVAVSDSPTGPFVDAIGAPLIQKDRDVNAGDEPIDPAVLIDDDGQAYLYFGTRVPKVVKLTADLLHLDGPIIDMSVSGNNYAEAPWMGKHNGTYYFSYSTGWPGQIAYGTSASPLGPFTFQGIVLDYDGISTNHASVVEDFKGKSYLFYHNGKLPGGGDYRRSINVDELHYDANGAITQVVQTSQGAACVP